MTRLLFVRHAESTMNLRPEVVGGRSNHAHPSKTGEEQAHRYGLYLKNTQLQPELVISSGAVRAHTTGEIALTSAGLNLEIIIDERLQEISQGSFEGKLRSEVYTPKIVEQYRLSELDGHLPGGESIIDAQIRMRDFLFDIHATHPKATILVFGHGLSIRALAGSILGQTKREILNTPTNNVSETRIHIENGQPIVHYVGKNVIGE